VKLLDCFIVVIRFGGIWYMIKKIVGRLSIVAMLIAMLGVGVLVTAKPAHAATVGCTRTGCNGLSPITEGCTASAYTISSGEIDDVWHNKMGAIYLNWSPGCKAYYAVTIDVIDSASSPPATIIAEVDDNIGGNFNGSVYHSSFGGTISPLLYETNATNYTAWGYIFENIGNGSIDGSATAY
jgi:hypothetical protein